MASTAPLTSFHRRLRQARRAAHLTQRVAAHVAGVARVTITHYEAGRVTPPIATAVSLARLYRVSVDWLVGLRQCKERTQRKDTIIDANLSTTNPMETLTTAHPNGPNTEPWLLTIHRSKGGEGMAAKKQSKAAPKTPKGKIGKAVKKK